MSILGMNSAMWNIYISADNTAQFLEDPDAYLEGFDLESSERDSLRAQNWGDLLERGAHPFLMYKMFLRTSGGFTLEALQRYLGTLHGRQLRDIVT